MSRRATAAVVLVLAVGACSGVSTDSGVRGVVLAGPQCPVEQIGSPCPDQPWTGSVQVRSLDGAVVREARTDAQGRFRVPLDPGTYVLAAVVEGPATATPAPVRVDQGRFTVVTVRVDTGIR